MITDKLLKFSSKKKKALIPHLFIIQKVWECLENRSEQTRKALSFAMWTKIYKISLKIKKKKKKILNLITISSNKVDDCERIQTTNLLRSHQ